MTPGPTTSRFLSEAGAGWTHGFYDKAKIDDAVLAVLYITAWEEHGLTKAWKAIAGDRPAGDHRPSSECMTHGRAPRL
jgi:hypothetical protein